ncbi:F-box domain containing protein [Trema orientale]|uniref:F-box domain containing protein n=1 Tax=Trema orientale TaxID=63057 RepID=A0A2P5EAR9_TREOI|nr:F-box domain containing protein [Trema orientale]
METRSAKKGKLWRIYNNGDGIDRISELPDALLHHILLLLPIKTVAKTSVLSKRWRSLWSTFPDLDFTAADSISFPTPKRSIYTRKPYYKDLMTSDPISQVLNLRDKVRTNSDIRSLRFHTTSTISFSRLNDVIRRAVRHNVQELDLQVATEDCISFPRSVMLSESLRVLGMRSRSTSCGSWFRLPQDLSVMKGGFRSLVSLSVSRVIFRGNDANCGALMDLFSDSSFPMMKKLRLELWTGMKQLRIGCRSLEEFELKDCFQLLVLDICSPKLERLRVESCFSNRMISCVRVDAPRLKFLTWENNYVTNTSLVNASNLHVASIGSFRGFDHKNRCVAKLKGLSNFLTGLSCVPCLKFEESQYIEILSNDNYFGVKLHPFKNLTSLELHTGVNKNTVPGLASMFRSSPMLHSLILKFTNKTEKREWKSDLGDVQPSSDQEELYWESQAETLNSFLQHLKILTIYGLFKCKKEVSLAKFLLKHGTALQEMTLCTEQYISNARDFRRQQNIIRSQVMGFSWASTNATITIC